MQRQLVAALALVSLAGGFHKQGVERAAAEKAAQSRPVVTPIEIVNPVEPTFDPAVIPEPTPAIEPQPESKLVSKPALPRPMPKQIDKPRTLKIYSDPVTGVDVPGSSIVMLSIDGCGACTRWWSQNANQLRSKGWTVRESKGVVPGVRSYPSFRVNIKGRWFTHAGPLTSQSLRGLLKIAAPDPKTIVNTSSRRNTSWLMDGQYWTRQSLIDHLASHPNHDHSRKMLERMTMEQLDALHTQDHVE